MNFKKSKTYFLSAILMSVSFLTQLSAARASEVDDVIVTGETLPVIVDPAKQELASASFCEDVSSIENSLEKMEKKEDPADYSSLIRSLVGSPIDASKFTKAPGWSRIGIVQRLESLRTLDLTLDPHASDYYRLLPENLDRANPNLRYYQWLSQVVYIAQVCLQNKLVDAGILQAGYSSYFCKGVKGFEWLMTPPPYFEYILKYLEKVEGQENPYSHLSPLYEQKRSELVAASADRTTLSCSHPIRGAGQFVVFNTKRGADTLLSAFGLSYDESVQILVDAVMDTRFLIKDKPGFYDNLNRRLYIAYGREDFVKQQIVLFLNHYINLTEPDSLTWIGKLLEGMETIGVASDKNGKLKNDYQRKVDAYEMEAPYLTEVGQKPEGEAELLSWNERLEDWKKAHQVDYNAWEFNRSILLKERDNQRFLLVYDSILSRIDQNPEKLAAFIREDFSRLFKETFVDLDHTDSFQTMAYVQPLLTFTVCNLFHWQLVKNTQNELQITSEWNYILSQIVHNLNVLKTVGEDGQVHYLKLVASNDYVGLAKAMRAERALGLTKVSALTQYGVSKSETVVSGYN